MNQWDKIIEDLQNEVKEFETVTKENDKTLRYSQDCLNEA